MLVVVLKLEKMTENYIFHLFFLLIQLVLKYFPQMTDRDFVLTFLCLLLPAYIFAIFYIYNTQQERSTFFEIFYLFI